MTRTGYRPSSKEALKALCCECCGNYLDGRQDCQVVTCPIYSRHPYRLLTPNYDWILGNAFNGRHYREKIEELGIGVNEFVSKYLLKSSGKLSINMIMRAKCYWCCGDFRQGMQREDCNIPECPIYYWMPYREQEPNYDWMFDLSYSKKHTMAASMNGFIRADGKIDRERYIISLDRRR